MLVLTKVRTSVKFDPLNVFFFKRRATYHFKVYEFRNLRAFDFFKLLTKVSFKSNLEFRNLKITTILIKPIKVLHLQPISMQKPNLQCPIKHIFIQ